MPRHRVRGQDYDVSVLSNSPEQVPIPYAVTLGAVNVIGVFYLEHPAIESHTEGAFVGAVNGTYNIDKDDAEACADNGVLKVCIRIVFADKKVQGRLCTRKPFGGWDCGGWKDIVSW